MRRTQEGERCSEEVIKLKRRVHVSPCTAVLRDETAIRRISGNATLGGAGAFNRDENRRSLRESKRKMRPLEESGCRRERKQARGSGCWIKEAAKTGREMHILGKWN